MRAAARCDARYELGHVKVDTARSARVNDASVENERSWRIRACNAAPHAVVMRVLTHVRDEVLRQVRGGPTRLADVPVARTGRLLTL
jgi:hypothetical protein